MIQRGGSRSELVSSIRGTIVNKRISDFQSERKERNERESIVI